MLGHDPDRTYRAAIIGAGSGGLTVAIALGRMQHDSVIIEGSRVGGDCTNVGCVPSKSLLHAARSGRDDPLGWVRSRRDALREREDSELVDHEHIHLVRGWARLGPPASPHVVAVDSPDGPIEIRAENVVLAGGSAPTEIPIRGLPANRVVTNETLFDLPSVPGRLAIVGGGPIGVEMATAFADLGTEVHIVELQGRLLPTHDEAVGDAVAASLRRMGARVHVGSGVEAGEETGDGSALRLTDGSMIPPVEWVLLALGRRPRLDRLGLDGAGVRSTSSGVSVDRWGRTNVAGIWALGDVTGATHTTHGAQDTGRRIARSIAFPRMPSIGMKRAVPSAVFSRPEVASVGLGRDDVERIPESSRRSYTVQLADIDRGYTDELDLGFVSVDVERYSGRILRATIVGPSAAELIGIFTLAIDQGIGLRKLFGMSHPYPTIADAIGAVADQFALDLFPNIATEWAAAMKGRLSRGMPRTTP